MKIHTQPVKGGAQKDVVWNRFRGYHYAPDVFNRACECYLVHVEGYGWVGFIAANLYRGKFGKDPRPVWYAHKTAIHLPIMHSDYFRLWALVADEQASMQVARGRRFVCMAPADHAAYRDLPNSGWEPSTTDKKRQQSGYRSHKYVGAAMATKAGA